MCPYRIQLALLLALTIIVNIGFNTIRMVIVAKVSQGIIHDIRKDLFDHLQALPFAYYDNRPHGKILVRVVHYVNNVSDALSNGILNFIIEIINIILSLSLCSRSMCCWQPLPWQVLPIVAGFILLIGRVSARLGSWFPIKTPMNAFVQESIEGQRVTQAFDRQRPIWHFE